jgi:hypothetical protein
MMGIFGDCFTNFCACPGPLCTVDITLSFDSSKCVGCFGIAKVVQLSACVYPYVHVAMSVMVYLVVLNPLDS